MDKNIKTVLNGVRLWVMSKISDINTTITNLINDLKLQTENSSFVISRHINELYDLVVYGEGKNIEIDNERNISALGYTHNKSNNSISDGEHTVARNTGEHATGKYNKSHRFYQSPNIAFVDLGLPSGTLWAKYNLGANSENTPGNRYAFAEITTKSTFTWDTYTSHAVVHTIDDQKIVKLTKYCPVDKPEYWETETPDNILQIENIDDVAYNTEVYEYLWNIPTTEQFKELVANTNKKLVRLDGNVYALEFRNKNQDLSIEVLRIPIFGIQMNETPFANNTQTQYWSSDINTDNPLEGICLKIVKTGNGEQNYTITNFTNQSEIKNACLQRFGGAFIRPVSQKIQSDGTQFSVGIGSQLERKNAMEVSNNGDIYVYGIGNYDGTKTKIQDDEVKTLQEVLYFSDDVRSAIAELQTDKLDKNNTANTIYGTNSTGEQTVYTLGNGLTNTNNAITLNTASKTNVGGVQIGDNINVSNGIISIPTASKSTSGIVKIGDNINVASGVISIPKATKSTLGLISVGANIDVSDTGAISIPIASTSSLGLISVGDNLTITAEGKLSAIQQHTSYYVSDNDAESGTYSEDISKFYNACVLSNLIQDVIITRKDPIIDPETQEQKTDPETGDPIFSYTSYYPSAQRIYEGNVELWVWTMDTTSTPVAWKQIYYKITNTITRTVTTGSFS